LNWLGKDKIVTHINKIPFHVLEHKYKFQAKSGTLFDDEINNDNASGNKIIHGDNLIALKSLLLEYENKIKCIYIDPPYNTGSENWVYNDNVNDPRFKKWLGEVVGKEGEDLTRHDKWLCMMYPRLQLLKRLLSEDGAIFISIDDNEQANLKLICDEIFGQQNFVANIPWRKRTAKSDVPHGISQDCELILCYAKSDLFQGAMQGKGRKYFETQDFPGRPWRFHDLTKQTSAAERPNSFFTIINPKNGKEYPANPLRTWAITQDTFKEYYDAGRIIFPGDYDFMKISKPVLRYWKDDDMRKAGQAFGTIAASTYLPAEVGMSQDGTKEIAKIFGDKRFNFPKPSSLIQYLINIATFSSPDSIILDSFAGSGTTAHAVLNLNQQDGGKRKFILIELEDYADNITAERVKRVMQGYSNVDGTGGSFDFYEVGEAIMIDNILNKNLQLEDIYKYIWLTETRTQYKQQEHKYYLGEHDGAAIYFYYEPDSITCLDFEFLSKFIFTRAERYIIYANTCALGDEFMRKYFIEFKKIPSDIMKTWSED
ncbi:MAG: site-specific DNA-methyltransferase, partial [Synergistaceae bacterium]|nr:site-specific DNA-methyltransferase [Synergistaceae bacterium]MBR1418577.1 site-specific DNA-methyltransferase [Synergistaceae bacterium]